MTDFLDPAPYELEVARSYKLGVGLSRRGVVAALADGITAKEIAEELGVCEGIVVGLGKSAGIDVEHGDVKWVEFLLGPICQGTLRRAAEILDTSPVQVFRLAKANKIDLFNTGRRSKFSGEE